MKPMSKRLGRIAVSYSIFYLRNRYRRQIRVGLGLLAATVAVAAFLATRNVREG